MERGIGFKNLWTDLRKDISTDNVSAGVVAAVFGFSAGVVHISAGNANNLPVELIVMWVTALYMINGIFGIFISAYYRQPIAMANSFPGALLFAGAIPVFGLGPVLGATLIAGVINVLFGISGLIGKIMKIIPMPVVMGMIGGVLLKFGINMAIPLQYNFIPAGLMITAYLVFTKWLPKFPGVLASLVTGVIWMVATGTDFSSIELTIALPTFTLPQFSINAFISYGIPLTIILVAMETPVGVGLLKSVGYKKVPANGITIANGFGTIVSSFFHLHSTVIAAPMTGICSSPEAGDKDGRWISAFVLGVLWIIGAPIYATITKIFQIAPPYFVNVIAGIALVRVLGTTIGRALGASSHKIGAVFAFLVAASQINILGIGSSFWSLVFGVIVSLIVETKDFKIHGEIAE